MSEYTYYEILDISPEATAKEIKTAYQRAVRVAHPDVGGNAAMFGMVRAAYETLGNPQKRSDYDAGLRDAAAAGPGGPGGAPSAPTVPEPEWGEEVDWQVDDTPRHGTVQPEWGQEVDAVVDDAPAFGTPPPTASQTSMAPKNRFETWASSQAGFKGLVAAALATLGLFALFTVIIFRQAEILRPAAATPDFVEMAFVDGPVLRIIAVVYIICLLGSLFGTAPYLLAAHAFAAVGLLTWVVVYWGIATTTERLAFAGLSGLWLAYSSLLVLVPVIVGARAPSEESR